MFPKILLIFLLVSCTSNRKTENKPESAITTKEFSAGELILGTELLTKIFDEEMAPISCVPDTDEAEILLRTIRPRMEVVQDDLEATLDNPGAVDHLVKTCDQNCTCGYVDELLREHLVKLTRAQRKLLNSKKTDKELIRCLNYVQTTFCDSELYKTLNKEKAEFTFEGET
ncbi:MAG: hypothetical protein ACLGHN_06065 [Bacteriovoracia bacterium]